MLKIDVNRIARKKGWHNVSEALVSGGFNKHKAWRIASGRIKNWDLNDIERLCELFKCTPDDLFVLTQDKGKTYGEDNPLRVLLRTNESFDVLNFLKSQPIDKVKEYEADMLKKRMELFEKK
jgi:DNA-binding Xre family transcriptional regulator